MNSAHSWSAQELGRDLEISKEEFRSFRIQEEPEVYALEFDRSKTNVLQLFTLTGDLSDLRKIGLRLLTTSDLFATLRYLTGPPISEDDLETIVNTKSFSQKTLKAQPELFEQVIVIIENTIDQRRFPWVKDRRNPTRAEKAVAILSTAALLASRRVETMRRNQAKLDQESRVEAALSNAGFEKLPRRVVRRFIDAPRAGQYCLESKLGSANRKADFTIGLWSQKLMLIECKVSNSPLNSIKRLNNDVVSKAIAWNNSLGADHVVPVAVLSGVFDLHNLQAAQNGGLTLFWAHDLKSMMDWIEGTRS